MSVENYQVTLSAPVLVARSKGYLWFPTLTKLANGDLRVIMSDRADAVVTAPDMMTGLNAFSRDSGRTCLNPNYPLTILPDTKQCRSR